MKFELTEKEYQRFKEWERSLPPMETTTAIGGAYTFDFIFSFTPTGIGDAVVVRRADGYECNLTDYDSW